MRLLVYLEPDPGRKRELQQQLTALLPAWFGQEASNTKYAQQAEVLEGYVAELDGVRRGLLLLKKSSPRSAEIYWMGVDPSFHRSGIGRALVDAALAAARRSGVVYMFVATLHPNDPYEPYQRTRQFYQAMGFEYVLEEQFPTDPDNVVAYFLKHL